MSKERILKTARLDGIGGRFLTQREQGLIKPDLQSFKDFGEAFNAIKAKQNLLLYGKVGRGKTYLAFELALKLKEQSNGEARIYYNRASVLLSEFKGNFKNISKTLSGVFAKESIFYAEPPTKCQLVIIDELHNIHNSEDFQIFGELIMTAYDNLVPVCFITNETPDCLLGLMSEMVLSRLQDGGGILTLHIQGEDLRGKN